MLEVLRGNAVSDVAAVVTRWFGGTLLGTGGLSKAYADAVRAALDIAEIIERVEQELCDVTVDLAATNPGQWMTHCHNAYHGEAGMMTTLSYHT